jgi:cystathionine beta-lyase
MNVTCPPSPTITSATSEAYAERRKYHPATECVYIENTNVNDPYNASSMPIYQTATFKQNSMHDMGEYDYSRSGNPTRSHVESHLAKMMKASKALCTTSGMTALDIILRLVITGQEIICGDDIYGGTNRLLTFLKSQNNIIVHHVDTTDPSSIKAVLNQNTAMVLLETPTNPLIKIANIPLISALVREYSKALVVVDNTMMSPYLQTPLELGADLVYHSGTKYLSGHHDLMCGVVGMKSNEIAEKLYFVVNSTGVGLAPFECFLLLRGIKTLSVRMDRQQASAMRIAIFLEDLGFIVRYPGLKSHPQHFLHMEMAKGAGAVLSFQTGDIQKSERIVEGTRLWLISVSFGCVNSLISMPCRMSHASIPESVRKERGFPEDLIRLCVGIEHVDDLIDDLANALQMAGYLITK